MKLKSIIIGIAILIVASAFVTANILIKQNKKLKSEIARVQSNNFQLMAENRKQINLELSFKEFKQSMTIKIDSILKASKIKAKNVTSITERYFYYRDTSYSSIRPDPVITPSGKIYPVDYKKDCFSFKGFMIVDTLLRPALIITDRKFENNTVDVGYIYRPKKFLGIRFGKWKGDLKSVSDCGDEKTKQIDIIKK